jgi:hypothetical protein
VRRRLSEVHMQIDMIQPIPRRRLDLSPGAFPTRAAA